MARIARILGKGGVTMGGGSTELQELRVTVAANGRAIVRLQDRVRQLERDLQSMGDSLEAGMSVSQELSLSKPAKSLTTKAK